MKKDRIRNSILLLIMLTFVILLCYVLIQKHTSIGFKEDTSLLYDSDWKQVMKDGTVKDITLPGKLVTDEDGTLVLEHALPQHVMDGLSLCIWVSKQSIKAEIDGEEITSYGIKERYIFGRNTGDYWKMINISKAYGGQKIRITLTSCYPTGKAMQVSMDHIYIGTQAALFFTLFKRFGAHLLVSFILILIALVIGIFYVVFRKLIGSLNLQRYLYLCSFSALMGVWLFVQSRLAQFFIGNGFLLVLVYYLGTMLLPALLLFFVAKTKVNHLRIPLIVLAYIFIGNAVVSTILQFAGVYDYYEIRLSTEILLLISSSLLLTDIIMEQFVYHNPEFRYLSIAIFFLLFSGLLEIKAYIRDDSLYVGNYVLIGTMLFVFLLLYDAAYNMIQKLDESKKAAYYQKLATVDIMANCLSRTAYNEEISKMDSMSLKGLCVLLMDLNNLKKINDVYGHLYGDQAIKTCSLCIRRVFQKVGDVYRIGGDEFVVLIRNCDENDLRQRLVLFQQLVERQNQLLPFEFQAAYGYAIYDEGKDHRIEDVIHRADEAMYARKKNMKAIRN